MVTSRSRLFFASAIALAVASMIVAGCASTDDKASGRAISAVAAPVTTAATASTLTNSTKCVKSLQPRGGLPAPMQMPTGSYMADIQARNKLTVGVDQNTLFFGYRNPRTNELAGFDIDVAKLIARAIFGDDQGHIDYVIVNTSERMPAVAGDPAGQNIKVDMVASLVTMTCARLTDPKYPVLFSSQYFDAAQGLLIRSSSHGVINGPDDLANKRVCATRGSTSSSHMRELQPKVKMVEVANRTECLVALQEGRVDAITADNTILYGFKRQDRTTEILPVQLSDEPYGLAINTAHPDFVRFVNAVLQQKRDDGTLESLARNWGGQAGVDFPPIPPAQYEDGS